MTPLPPRQHPPAPVVRTGAEQRIGQLAVGLDGAQEDDADLYVMINCGWQEKTFTLQQPDRRGWKLVVDTSRDSPDDFPEPERALPLSSKDLVVRGRSVMVLVRPRQ